MQSKNKKAQTVAEAAHTARVAELDCIVCEAQGPSQVHEPEQGMWYVSIPLCPACHTGPQGWHGTRLRWTLRKMGEIKAINATLQRLMS